MHFGTLAGVTSPKVYAAGTSDGGESVDLNPLEPIRFIILHVGLTLDSHAGSIELDVQGGPVCGITNPIGTANSLYGSFQVFCPIEQGDTVTINNMGGTDGSFIIAGVYWSAGE